LTLYPEPVHYGEVVATGRPLPALTGRMTRLAGSFAASSVDVPAVHRRIRLHAGGELVGEVELLAQSDGKHLVVGEMEWQQPDGRFGLSPTSAEHYAAVVDRLLIEAVAEANRIGATLTVMTPGTLATAEMLRERGFRLSGDRWVLWRS
jgi:hypothetical protein